jgi:hypothetical protein
MSEAISEYKDIIACDFSFRRPGFAYLRYNPKDRNVKV